MITAQDIREKTFEKSAFGGYVPGEVDDFLDALSADMAAAQKESATLRTKMKVLVDKIEEYRESEDAMRLALVSAQKVAKTIQDDARTQADELLANAKAEADRILSEAKAEADSVLGGLTRQREAEELRLQKAQTAAADYVQKFRMVLEHESNFLDSLVETDFVQEVIVTPAPEEPKAIAAPAQAAGEEETPADAPEAEEAAPAAEEAGESAVSEFAKAAQAVSEPAPEPDDYVAAFEKAVYKLSDDDAIPDAGEDDAPSFRF